MSFEESAEFKNKHQSLMGTRPDYDKIDMVENLVARQNYKLIDAKKTAYDTEQTAIEIQRNMRGMTDKLESSIEKTKETRSLLGISNNYLNSIRHRIIQRRIMLYSVLFFLFVLMCYILYHNFF